MTKNTGLIVGLIAGAALGVLVSPKKVYEIKMKTGENYNHFIEENGPISKEMILKLIQEKRDYYSKKKDKVVVEAVENISETTEEASKEAEKGKDIVTEAISN
ncbi:YtxH domain-containing protein [Lactococcus lactis]|uniref:YtxH domain-containing protein n=1 Tax=Lactococcus lactis TaxID=1358 RepID=A0A9X4NJK7_9LACT|nr:YtxH domain-containing protein [Lactococcus lactis]MDG4984962.1 YtxH domain-containing protein [Lactococcus lactis]